MMKVLRVLGGWLIIAGGAFCCLIAYSQGGGMDNWDSFEPSRMLEREPVFAIGGPILLLLGVLASNTGSRLAFLPALLLALAAAWLGMWAGTTHHLSVNAAKAGLIGAAVLALAASITAALGRRRVAPAV